MNKKTVLIFIVVIALCFVGIELSWIKGSDKCTITEFTDRAVITDSYHSGMWVQNICVGKTTSTLVHPAINKITVEYMDSEYVFKAIKQKSS